MQTRFSISASSRSMERCEDRPRASLQNGNDVDDFVLGEKLRFDRRLETCRRRRSGGGYVQFELGRKWKLVKIAIRTFRDTGHLGGCNLGLA